MSMPIIEQSPNPIDREQSINDLIESIALMEAGLSHVINAEGEKIQKVTDPDADYSIEEIINVNNSAEKMLGSVARLEMILQSKLETSKGLDENNRLIESSYVEVTGNTQSLDTGDTVIFSDVDIVGSDINFVDNEFIINSPGLYSIEWNVNLAAGNPQSLIGTTENDEPVSAMCNSATAGNSSSGSLIHVETVPYRISLVNFGPTIILENFGLFEETAVSFRIFKFADAPK